METNVILQFQRLCDCWLCPDCACENTMEDGVCTVCGAYRTEAAPVIRAGQEEMPVAGYSYYRNPVPASNPVPVAPISYAPPGTKVYAPPTYVPEESSNVGMIVAISIIAIFVLCVIIGVLASA